MIKIADEEANSNHREITPLAFRRGEGEGSKKKRPWVGNADLRSLHERIFNIEPLAIQELMM
jgi:hypothetical protein